MPETESESETHILCDICDTNPNMPSKNKGKPAVGTRKNTQSQVAPSQANTADVLKELIKDDHFKSILRESVSSIVTSVTAEVTTQLKKLISQNRDLIDRQAGEIHDINVALDRRGREIDQIWKLLEHAKTTAKDLEGLKQYSRRNSALIIGIPETKDEHIDDLVLDFAKSKLGITLQKNEIDRAHRVGKPRDDQQEQRKPRPRPVLVKFCTYRTKAVMMRNKSRLKGTGLGLVEDLTARNFQLLKDANACSKVESAWTIDGRIFVALESVGPNGTKIKKMITSKDQLASL